MDSVFLYTFVLQLLLQDVWSQTFNVKLLRLNLTSIATTDSSDALVYNSKTFRAGYAIDGNAIPKPDACNCCFSSGPPGPNYNATTREWLQVDLKSPHRIDHIVITGRDDKRKRDQNVNFTIFLGNDSMANTSPVTQVLYSGSPNIGSYTYNISTAVGTANQSMSLPILARFIKIERNSSKVMTICEIEVFEKVCQEGYFGNSCQQCGHCSIGTTCDKVTGECKGGCEPGRDYNTDKMCKTSCASGMFGQNCSQACGNCSGKAECNVTDGVCQFGCLDGYSYAIDKRCKTLCSQGYYGRKCSLACGHCSDGKPCDAVTGHCPSGCEPGYSSTDIFCNTLCVYGPTCPNDCGYCANGTTCDAITGDCPSGCSSGFDFTDKLCKTRCRSGRYGPSCSLACGHCDGSSSCNAITGLCPSGCAPGFTNSDMFCKTPCRENAYGENCSLLCHCYMNRTCDHVTGICPDERCKPGYTGLMCQTKICVYGPTCPNDCGYCANGTTCDAITGDCPSGCSSGLNFKDKLCKTRCRSGRYGPSCSLACGHCDGSSSCNAITGLCPSGCAPGFTNSDMFCKTPCRENTYGENCSLLCHCYMNRTCDHVTGICPDERCEPGYSGLMCQTKSQTLNTPSTENGSTTVIISASCGTAVLIGIGIAVGVFLYKRRKTKGPDTLSEYAYIDDSTLSTTIDHSLEVGNDNPGYQRHDPEGGETSSLEDGRHSDKLKDGAVEYYSFDNFSPGIKIYELWDYIKKNMKEDHFDNEFAKLPQGMVLPHNEGTKHEHRLKNRYRDMLAYDHSRVHLAVEQPGDSDYINASYVNGFGHPKKFIASQGPTNDMIDDFWMMVWQENVKKIVMLTRIQEIGIIKCLQYWPKEDSESTSFGNLSVRLQSTKHYPEYTIRELHVTQDEITRPIRQYHFMAWPDKDVPGNAWCLVDFWRTVDTNEKSTTAPIVVHCSAGVGRTGTFIALDTLALQAKSEGCVRPAQVVEALRRQRVNMVKTKAQYLFLHEVVAEALLVGTRCVKTKHFVDVYRYMTAKEEGSDKTRMDQQFYVIMRGIKPALAPKPHEFINVDENHPENEAYITDRKPNESTLEPVYLQNFERKDTMILLKSPRQDQLEEFWSLVIDHNIETIASVASGRDGGYQENRTLAADTMTSKYVIDLVEESETPGFTERRISCRDRSKDDDDVSLVKQFEYLGWGTGSDVPNDTQSMLDFLVAVQRWQQTLQQTRPVLVHCESGYKQSGVVAALLSELYRIQCDHGNINIVETVKTMKENRREIIVNKSQYKYCYDVILSHVEEMDIYQNV